MKIALIQTKFKKFDIIENTSRICRLISTAKQREASLVFLPELSLSGGYVGTLSEYKNFAEELQIGFDNIAKQSVNCSIIIGSYYPENNDYINAFLLFQNGKLESIYPKKHIQNLSGSELATSVLENTTAKDLPTFFIGKKCISLAFIDDLRMNHTSIAHNLADIILCSDIAPFHLNIREERHEILRNLAIKTNSNIVFLNQTGSHVSQVHDGGSCLMNKSGDLNLELPFFGEELAIIETDTIFDTKIPTKEISKTELTYKALVLGIKDYFAQNGKKQAVVGLSGGIDSALVATLSVHALGSKNVHGIMLPSMYSTDHSIEDAKNLAENLHISYDVVPIKSGYDAIMNILNPIFDNKEFDVTEENLQARLRAVILMSFSNKHGHLLVNTSNKSEAAAGYGTMYGDLCGGLSVIGDLYKKDVYELSKWINRNAEIIPKNSIEKAPSAELRPGQKDSDSLPEYELLDKIVYAHLEEKKSAKEIINMGFDRETVTRILHLIRINEYKRFQCPPAIRISKHAFGIDRNVPLVW